MMLVGLVLVYGLRRNTRKIMKVYKDLDRPGKKIYKKEKTRIKNKNPNPSNMAQSKQTINRPKEMTYRLDKEEVAEYIKKVVDLNQEDKNKLGPKDRLAKVQIIDSEKANKGKELVLAYELMAGPLSRRKKKTR